MDGSCEDSEKKEKERQKMEKKGKNGEETFDCWYRTTARSRGIDDYTCAPQLPVISI